MSDKVVRSAPVPHVAVCVLTFRRGQLLAKCLLSLVEQAVGEFSYSITVIDNDASGSAQEIVEETRRRSTVSVNYRIEPEQSISRARNLAVRASVGEYIAFVDDDEVVARDWLARMIATCESERVDGVLGPVLPQFEGTPPTWLVESGLCDREQFATGTRLENPKFMRTGNVVFARRIVAGEVEPFDLRFGRTGGEDADFFERKLHQGYSFAWNNDARVFEWVPKERQLLVYHVRRGIFRGVAQAEMQPLTVRETIRSVAATFAYAALLPIAVIFSRARFARYLVSMSDHSAKVLAHFGVRLAKRRDF